MWLNLIIPSSISLQAHSHCNDVMTTRSHHSGFLMDLPAFRFILSHLFNFSESKLHKIQYC